MPQSQVNSFMKQSGKSKSEVEKELKLAKKDAEDMGQEGNWAYIVAIWKTRLGLDEQISDAIIGEYLAEKYINSNEITWDKFIETMVSGDFKVTPENVVDPEEQDKDKENT